MEIRLIINGNLVQTMVLPKLALICSKVIMIDSYIYLNDALVFSGDQISAACTWRNSRELF
jgi:hypothetical protein